MVGQKNVRPELFFKRLFSSREFRGNEQLLDVVVQAAKDSNYGLPVTELIAVQEERMDEFQELINSSPIGDTGDWLTFDQVSKLGLDQPEKLKLVLEGAPKIFPKNQAGQYFINPSNLSFLDKSGKHANLLVEIGKYSRVMTRLNQLNRISAGLEQVLQEEEIPQPKSEIARESRVETINGNLGVWLTGAEIHSLGSELGKAYVVKKIKENKGSFEIKELKEKYKPLAGFITLDNFSKVGLTHFPLPYVFPVDDASRKVEPPKIVNKLENPEFIPTPGGIFMTYREIAKHSKHHEPQTVSAYVSIHREEFQQRRKMSEGKKVLVLITPENCKYVGMKELPKIPDGSRIEISPEDAHNIPYSGVHTGPESIFRIGNGIVKIESARIYDVGFVSDLLKKVHDGYFGTPIAVNRALDFMGRQNGGVTGSGLSRLLSEVNGMMLLSTTSVQKQLEDLTGMAYTDLQAMISANPPLEKFVHRLNGAVESNYVTSSGH